MSDTEEENYCFYGTPLDPYDEDTFPKRKPIGIEEQIATDAQGRRRFHGAFTGGFSAGFFNTVGTPEGWTPTEFKSSRAEKASSKLQKPQDFMDDEDMGEFGFAPQTVKATDEFSTKRKRKKQPFSTGPIPGVPVLHSILQVHSETIGYTLMKNMGWKVAGDSDQEDEREEEDEEEACRDGKKVYGCVIPKAFRMISSERFTVGSNAPTSKQPYDDYIACPKDNSFGMGYSGLDRSIFGHVNLLEPSKLVVRDKSSKRATIRGQAFGVGAFEREDEDIYRADDMTRYDFALGESPAQKEKGGEAPERRAGRQDRSAPDQFTRAQFPFVFPSNFPAPAIPHSFTGRHKVKRSRFEPLLMPEVPSAEKLEKKAAHDAETRAELLRDHREKQREDRKRAEEKNAEARKRNLEMLFASDRFVASASAENLQGKTLQTSAEMVASLTENLQGKTLQTSEEMVASLTDNSDGKAPSEESPFFRDRFVCASRADDPTNALVEVQRAESLHGTKDGRKAAEMKMFGALTRTTSNWNPSPFLCKKFNVPPPIFDGSAEKSARKRTKLLVFEYQKAKDADSGLKPGLTETKPAPEAPQAEEAEAAAEEAEAAPEEVVEEEKEAARVPEVPQVPQVVEEEKELISPEKDMDLFKAVFLSSSEEEDSDTEDKGDGVKEESHLDIIAKEVTEAVLPKIVSKRIGILSNLTFAKPPAARNVPQEDKTDPKVVPEKKLPDHLYGPQLPARGDAAKATFSNDSVKVPKADNEEWIEKGALEKSKKSDKRKKKKHKKESDRRKHKSKHKKHKKDGK